MHNMASTSITIKNYLKDVPGKLEKYRWEFPVINTTNRHGRNAYWHIYVGLIRPEHDEDGLSEDQTTMLDETTLDNFDESQFIAINQQWIKDVSTQLQSRTGPIYAWYKIDSAVTGGKIKQSAATIVNCGKNIGKANETNVLCQALRDAYGKYNKQLRKSVAQVDIIQMYPPMLASTIENINYSTPKYIQRKYNGTRAVAKYHDGSVYLYSRSCKMIVSCKHIRDELVPILQAHPKIYIDGEIYKHGMSLQDISGRTRKIKNFDDSMLSYMVYDCFDPDTPMNFAERNKLLSDMFAGVVTRAVSLVETLLINSADEADKYYKQYLAEGYEGAILRENTPYEFSRNSYHSSSLIKLKPAHDGEYEMIGFTQAVKGKSLGALVLICRTAEGEEFNVQPAGEIQKNKDLYTKFSKGKYFEKTYKGKMLIVTYDEHTKSGVPSRARTYMQWRDMETDTVYPVE